MYVKAPRKLQNSISFINYLSTKRYCMQYFNIFFKDFLPGVPDGGSGILGKSSTGSSVPEMKCDIAIFS